MKNKVFLEKKYDFQDRFHYLLSFDDESCDAILQKVNNEWLLVDMLKNKNYIELMKIYVTLLILNKMIEKEEIDTIKRKEFENKGLDSIDERIEILKKNCDFYIAITLDDYNLELIFK